MLKKQKEQRIEKTGFPTKGDGLMSHPKINFNIELTLVTKINSKYTTGRQDGSATKDSCHHI